MRSYEFREALAALKTRPLFILSVVATLAVTLGILLCMINLNHVLLVKALPYQQQQRLMVAVGSVYENNEVRYPDMASYPIAQLLEKQADVEALAVLNFSEEIVTNVPQRPKLRVTNATPRYFDMLSTAFAKGRGFAPENGVGSRDPVAILSYEAWQRHFAGSASILGEKVIINDITYRIIGVTARDFVEPELFQAGMRTQVWLPWEFNSWQQDMHKNWAGLTDQLKVLALLKPNQTLAAAEQMFNGLIAPRFREETQGAAFLKGGEYRIQAQDLKSYLVEDSRVAALLFLASSIALVIIACINVVNLLLSRAAEQQRQLAIRATLGAHQGHIFRHVLAEHLLLITASMLIALVLAQVVTRAMRERLQDQLPRIAELSLSPVTVLLAVALVIGLALAFAGIVARAIDYRRLAGLLNSSGKGAGLQISARIRRFLVVSQIALAAFLLVAIASVLQVSYETVTRVPHFRVDDVVFANLSTGSLDLNEPTRIRYIDEIEARLRQLPQVSAVSNALFVPMMSNRWTTGLRLDPAGTDSYSVGTNAIDDKYLAVMGEQIVSGNNFSRQDVNVSAKKMLVNETLASKIAPSGSALGKQVYWIGESPTPTLYEVTGIVRDVAVPRMATLPRVYLTRFDGLRFIVQLKPGQTLARDEFLDVIGSVNKAFNLYEYETVRDMYDRLTLKDRFIVWVAIGLGLLTVALAAIGIYGVLSYGVQLRRYELGVRMSIGAGPQQIAALVYGENLRLLLVGALTGLAILMACDLLLLQFADYRLPLTFATGAAGYLVIIASVALACYLSLRAVITRWPVFALRT